MQRDVLSIISTIKAECGIPPNQNAIACSIDGNGFTLRIPQTLIVRDGEYKLRPTVVLKQKGPVYRFFAEDSNHLIRTAVELMTNNN